MSGATAPSVRASPTGTLTLPDLYALSEFGKAVSEDVTTPSLPELLVSIDEKHNDGKSLSEIIMSMSVKLAPKYFQHDTDLASRVLRLAYGLYANADLFWGALRDFFSPLSRGNPAVYSPTGQNEATDDIAAIRSLLEAISPERQPYLGLIDYLTCDHSRSILSPSAYLVDLLRIISSDEGFGESEAKMDEQLNSGIVDKIADGQKFLRARRPDIYDMLLSPENTDDTIPYPAIVNNALSSIVLRNAAKPGEKTAYEVLARTHFPIMLPYNGPLLQTRLALDVAEIEFCDVLRASSQLSMLETFGTLTMPKNKLPTRETQELLGLVPEVWDIVANVSRDPSTIAAYYGFLNDDSVSDTAPKTLEEFLESLSDLDTFLGRCSLTREECNNLLYQNLSDAEIDNGLSRLFFINDVDDGLPPLKITVTTERYLTTEEGEIKERLWYLSWQKLDRIHRFIRLARAMEWSFEDLDFAIGAVCKKLLEQEMDLETTLPSAASTQALLFDGADDCVYIPLKDDEDSSYFKPAQCTVELWAKPSIPAGTGITERPSTSPTPSPPEYSILCGFWSPEGSRNDSYSNDTVDTYKCRANWLVFINSALQVCVWTCVSTANDLVHKMFQTDESLLTDRFTHVAVTMDHNTLADYSSGEDGPAEGVVDVYFNGAKQTGFDPTLRPSSNTEPQVPYIFISLPKDEAPRESLTLGLYFAGSLRETRIWSDIRSGEIIERNKFFRLTGFEENLIGYWPMAETIVGAVKDFSGNHHTGNLGLGNGMGIPKWMSASLAIDPAKNLDSIFFERNLDLPTSLSADLSVKSSLSASLKRNLAISFWIQLHDLNDHVRILNLTMSDDSLLLSYKSGQFNLKYHSQEAIIPCSTHEDLMLCSLEFSHSGKVKLEVNRGTRDRSDEEILSVTGPSSFALREVTIGEDFRGEMSDLKIWTVPIQDGEEDMHFSPLTAEGAKIVAHWPMNASSLQYDTSTGSNMLIDVTLNPSHLRTSSKENFSPSLSKNPSLHDEIKAMKQSENSGTILQMDSRTSIEIRSKDIERFGIGQVFSGTISMRFKCASVSPFKNQVLFSHGDDDVGINIYIQDNCRLAIIVWKRPILDGGEAFGPATRTTVLDEEEMEKVIPIQENNWYHLILSFIKVKGVERKPSIYDIKVNLNDSFIGELRNCALPPTGTYMVGGIAEKDFDSPPNAWIVFKEEEGLKYDMREELFFSGDLKSFRLWSTSILEAEYRDLESAKTYEELRESLLVNANFAVVCPPEENIEWIQIDVSGTYIGDAYPKAFEATIIRTLREAVASAGDMLDSKYLVYLGNTYEASSFSIRGEIQCVEETDGAAVMIHRRAGLTPGGEGYHNGIILIGLLGSSKIQYTLEKASMVAKKQVGMESGGSATVDFPKIARIGFEMCTSTQDGRTLAQAKVWEVSEVEPEFYQLELIVDGTHGGNIAFWGIGKGEKKFNSIFVGDGDVDSQVELANFDDDQKWSELDTLTLEFENATTHVIPKCLGWDVGLQDTRKLVMFDLSSALETDGWVANEKFQLSVSGSLMFENDNGCIGMFLGTDRDNFADGWLSSLWGFVRDPFEPRELSSQLDNAFCLRSEWSTGGGMYFTEASGIDCQHSRWYSFHITLQNKEEVLRADATFWEQGSERKVHISDGNLKISQRDVLGLVLMGNQYGRKYFKDLNVTLRLPGKLSRCEIGLPFSNDQWISFGNVNSDSLVGFGEVQPRDHISGQSKGEGNPGLHTIFCPSYEMGNSWQNTMNRGRYKVRGRMYLPATEREFGFTLYNNLPVNRNVFYNIGISTTKPDIYSKVGFGDRVSLETTSVNYIPIDSYSKGWHKFEVEVSARQSNDSVHCKLWKETERELSQATAVFENKSQFQLKSGTFGFWSPDENLLISECCLSQRVRIREQFGPFDSWEHCIGREENSFGSHYTDITDSELPCFVITDDTPEGKRSLVSSPEVTLGPKDLAFSFSPNEAPGHSSIRARVNVENGGSGAGFLLHVSQSYTAWAVAFKVNKSGQNGSIILNYVSLADKETVFEQQPEGNFFNTLSTRQMLDLDLTAGSDIMVLVELRPLRGARREKLVRVRAKIWSDDTAEPNTFQLISYARKDEPWRFGVFHCGEGSKIFKEIHISREIDTFSDGTHRPIGMNYKDVPKLDPTILSPVSSFSSSVVGDISEHLLGRDDCVPISSPILPLRFGGSAASDEIPTVVQSGAFLSGTLQHYISKPYWSAVLTFLPQTEGGPDTSRKLQGTLFYSDVAPISVVADGTGNILVKRAHLPHPSLNVPSSEMVRILISFSVAKGENPGHLTIWVNDNHLHTQTVNNNFNEGQNLNMFIGRSDALGNDFAECYLLDALLLQRSEAMNSRTHSYRTHNDIASIEYSNGNLVASWPPFKSKVFLFGGAPELRSPSTTSSKFPSPMQSTSPSFLTRSSVLVFSGDGGISIPATCSGSGEVEMRLRTVEVVFTCETAFQAQNSEQILYGEDLLKLKISNGKLVYEITDDYAWFKPFEVHIRSDEWYVATLVLSASRDLRNGALACYLNGAALGVKEGTLIRKDASTETLVGTGGFRGAISSVTVLFDSLEPAQVEKRVSDIRDGNIVDGDGAHLFLTADTLDQVMAGGAETLSGVSVQAWNKQVTPIPDVSFSDTLDDLSILKEAVDLKEEGTMFVVCAWGYVMDYGKGDGPSLFDQIYNKPQSTEGGVWSYGMQPIPFNPSATETLGNDWVIKTRLISASGLADSELTVLFDIVGFSGVIDGSFLEQFANAFTTVNILGIAPTDLKDFLDLNEMKWPIGPRDLTGFIHFVLKLDEDDLTFADIVSQMKPSVQVDSASVAELAAEVMQDSVSYVIDSESFSGAVQSSEQRVHKDGKLQPADVSGYIQQLQDRSILDAANLVQVNVPFELGGDLEWVATMKASFYDLLCTEFEAAVENRNLSSQLALFGETEMLMNALEAQRYIFGDEMYRAISVQLIENALTAAGQDHPSIEDAAPLYVLLAAEVLPNWAAKSCAAQEILLQSVESYCETFIRGFAKVFKKDVQNVAVVTSWYAESKGKTLKNMIREFMSYLVMNASEPQSSDEDLPNENVDGECDTAGARIGIIVKNSEVEVLSTDEMVQSMSDICKVLNLMELFNFSVEEAVLRLKPNGSSSSMDYINPSLEDMIECLVEDEIKRFVYEVQEATDMANVGTMIYNTMEIEGENRFSAIADLFKMQETDVKACLSERDTLGNEKTTFDDLWYTQNAQRIATKMVGSVYTVFELKNDQPLAEYQNVATAIVQTLSGSADSSIKSKLQEMEERVLESERDALMNMTVSLVTDTPSRYNAATSVTSDYLLLDVETNAKVLASPIQQGIQSVQLYIHRTILGLERKICIPIDLKQQWDDWLQAYRVWEAARKVYLYPENYVEPELRPETTYQYENLMKNVSGGSDESSINTAFNTYVEEIVRDLTNMRVAGAGLSSAAVDEDGEEPTLFLTFVGKTRGSPPEFYTRQRISNKSGHEWTVWKHVQQSLPAEWISPVVAFGRLYLFWVVWQENKVQHYVYDQESWKKVMELLDDGSPCDEEVTFLQKLRDPANHEKRATDDEEEFYFVLQEFMDAECYNRNKGSGNTWEIEEMARPPTSAVPLVRPEIQFTSESTSGTFASPQAIAVNDVELYGDITVWDNFIVGDHRIPSYQRLNCMRTAFNERQIEESFETIVTNPRVFDPPRSDAGIRLEMSDGSDVQQSATFEVILFCPQVEDAASRLSSNFEECANELQTKRTDEEWNFYTDDGVNGIVSLITGPDQFAIDLKASWVEPIFKLDEAVRFWEDPQPTEPSPPSSPPIDTGKEMLIPSRSSDSGNNNETLLSVFRSSATECFGDDEAIVIFGNRVMTGNPDHLTSTDLFEASFNAKTQQRGGFMTFYIVTLSFRLCSDQPGEGVPFFRLAEEHFSSWFKYSFSMDISQDTMSLCLETRDLSREEFGTQDEPVYNVDSLPRPAEFGQDFRIGEFVASGGANGLSCQLCEARLWDGNDVSDKVFNPGAARNTAYRLSLNDDDSLLGVSPLTSSSETVSTADGMYMFPTSENLNLIITHIVNQDLNEEMIIIVLHDKVLCLKNGAASFVQIINDIGNRSCQTTILAMYPNGNENAKSTIYSATLENPPQLCFGQEGSRLDFYSGEDVYGMNGASMLTKATSDHGQAIESEKHMHLMEGPQWKSSTLQPVQNAFGMFVLESQSDIFLLERAAFDGSLKEVSETLLISNGSGDDTDTLYLQITDYQEGTTPYKEQKYRMQRVSSFASVKFRAKVSRKGADGLYVSAMQKLKESQVTFQGFDMELPEKGPSIKVNIVGNNINVYPLWGDAVRKIEPSFAPKESDISTYNMLDMYGTNKDYFYELFMHTPLLVGSTLNAAAQFPQAMKWYEYIYRPIRTDWSTDVTYELWQFLPFQAEETESVDNILDILDDEQSTQKFRLDPFNAHHIASRRAFSYQRSIFSKYVTNLIDFGDSLFIDDRESMNQAMLYYFQAATVLGDQPKAVRNDLEISNTTARTIESMRTQSIPDSELFKLNQDFVVPRKTSENFMDPVALMVSFSVPENENIMNLWTRTQDRLYKIRNSLNIDGVFRQVPLFAPPIDPAQLVSAAASGMTAIQAASTLQRSVPNVRFEVIYEQARELASLAEELNSEMIDAINSCNSEYLEQMENQHMTTINQINVDISERELAAARLERQSIESNIKGLEATANRLSEYLENGQRFATEFLPSILSASTTAVSGVSQISGDAVGIYEREEDYKEKKKKTKEEEDRIKKEKEEEEKKASADTEESNAQQKKISEDNDKSASSARKKGASARKKSIATKQSVAALKGVESGMDASAAIVNAIPETNTGCAGLGPLVSVGIGGDKLAKNLQIAGDVIGFGATILEITQSIAEMNVEREASRHEWEVELNQTKFELQGAKLSLQSAVESEQSATLSLDVAEKDYLHSMDLFTFHISKFNNLNLYSWLSNELSRMNRRLYDLALDCARDAERSLQYEMVTDKKFISGTGWNESRKGMLAAKILDLELLSMMNFRTTQNVKGITVQRRISLKTEFPDAFHSLLTTGTTEIDVSELFLDRDYVGHYRRILKNVCVIFKPNDTDLIQSVSIRGTLTQISNHVVMTNDIDTVKYLIGLSTGSPSSDVPESSKLRSNWRSNQVSALSSWNYNSTIPEDNIDFDKEDLYEIYEGTGAVSKWRLEVPIERNPELCKVKVKGAEGEYETHDYLAQFDYEEKRTVDIQLFLSYNCLADNGPFATAVDNEVKKSSG